MALIARNRQPNALRWVVLLAIVATLGITFYRIRQTTQRTPASSPTIPSQSPAANLPIQTVPTKLTPGTSWQLQLSGTVDPTILDAVSNPKKMFDVDLVETPQNTIDTLKAKGVTVICYFSAGSAEDFRTDYNQFPTTVKGKGLDGWPGEFWLDVRNIATLLPIMQVRMDLAVSKHCDGIDPDNLDGYTNETGFPLTANDQLAYNRALAEAGQRRGLLVGLKNDINQVAELSNDFDWALNEQCFQFNECDVYQAFTTKNKAVFGVEYQGSTSDFCAKANAANLDWLKKELSLDALPRVACRLD